MEYDGPLRFEKEKTWEFDYNQNMTHEQTWHMSVFIPERKKPVAWLTYTVVDQLGDFYPNLPRHYVVIDLIMVHERYRNRGIAKRILSYFFKQQGLDYKTQIFWHRLMEGGKVLKKYFDSRYGGSNANDDLWRQKNDV